MGLNPHAVVASRLQRGRPKILRDGSQTGIDVRGLKPTAILPRIENCEMSTHHLEGNRDLEIATCPANHPEIRSRCSRDF